MIKNISTLISAEEAGYLDLLEKIKSGQIKECVCNDVVIYNLEWGMKHNIAPRVTSRWIETNDDTGDLACENCKKRVGILESIDFHFCPYCGAYMMEAEP